MKGKKRQHDADFKKEIAQVYRLADSAELGVGALCACEYYLQAG